MELTRGNASMHSMHSREKSISIIYQINRNPQRSNYDYFRKYKKSLDKIKCVFVIKVSTKKEQKGITFKKLHKKLMLISHYKVNE